MPSQEDAGQEQGERFDQRWRKAPVFVERLYEPSEKRIDLLTRWHRKVSSFGLVTGYY
jgi:hypothetical protein